MRQEGAEWGGGLTGGGGRREGEKVEEKVTNYEN